MRFLRTLALISANLPSLCLIAQIQTGELPPSISEQTEKANSSSHTMKLSDPDLTALQAEDAVTDQHKDIAWRFGTVVNVSYSLQNSGEWNHDDNEGISTWKLKISFQQAQSINLNFNYFKLSSNAKLFVYNDNYSDVLGAITSKNNKADRQFSIRPIKGNSITLELIVPQAELETNSVSINEIIYGYRSIHEKVQKVFQSSGGCNININCEEGKNWQDVKRSVAMILSASNSRICTGTLINNVRQDSTPYFLTAAHCSMRNNSVVVFGYESALCNPNTDGVLSNSISGSSRKAISVNFGSDFELRELSSTPPASYNVYYAGWNRANAAATASVGIHHPTGDVKKISIDNDALTSGSYYSNGTSNSHWVVGNWEKGTTESGSSGSALFDLNQRIIGQLEGGTASCRDNLSDLYGKFSRSWDFSADMARQLKHWLDPDNTGAIVLNGLDPNPSYYSNDLSLIDVEGIPKFACTQSIQPTFRIKNVGGSSVDSLIFEYELNGSPLTPISMNNTINKEGVISVTIPSLNLQSGINQLKYSVRILGQADQNLINNSDSVSFTINTSTNELLNVTLKTDDYGGETSWQLEDLNTGLILHTSPSYPNVSNGAVYSEMLCAYTGCFRFTIYDSQNDGFNDPTGRFGNGYAIITGPLGDTLYFENNFRNSATSDTFCIQFATSISENNINRASVNVYPNPVKPGNNLCVIGDKAVLSLRNAQGQLILEKIGNEIRVPEGLSSGLYLLEVRNANSNNLIEIKKMLVE